MKPSSEEAQEHRGVKKLALSQRLQEAIRVQAKSSSFKIPANH
jgi:hypothetical protein